LFGDVPDRLLDVSAVVRFEQRKKQLPGHGLVASDAEKISRHVGPFQFLRDQVEIPGSDAESLDPEPEMFMSGYVSGRLNDAGHA
jgi:hypothetical protein